MMFICQHPSHHPTRTRTRMVMPVYQRSCARARRPVTARVTVGRKGTNRRRRGVVGASRLDSGSGAPEQIQPTRIQVGFELELASATHRDPARSSGSYRTIRDFEWVRLPLKEPGLVWPGPGLLNADSPARDSSRDPPRKSVK